jgi:hypothetical protein
MPPWIAERQLWSAIYSEYKQNGAPIIVIPPKPFKDKMHCQNLLLELYKCRKYMQNSEKNHTLDVFRLCIETAKNSEFLIVAREVRSAKGFEVRPVRKGDLQDG